MGRKIKPDLLRLGINKPWSSRWLLQKNNKFFLEEDCFIRDTVEREMHRVGISAVDIERTREDIEIFIRTSKPGLIIGRKGSRIEELKNKLNKGLRSIRKEHNIGSDFKLNINVVELKRSDMSASVLVEQIASDIERRIPFRSVMKRHMRRVEQNREVRGAKIQVAGRLNGADIARTEKLSIGKMPMNTLRANIDYGETTARTTYGAIGIKAWLYKGEIFNEE